MSLADVHLLRPWWLLALLPALWLVWRVHRSHGRAGRWQQVIDPTLLPHLLATGSSPTRLLTPANGLLLAWLTAILALAGPSWERQPVAASQQQDALIIVLDLTLSMYAQDLPPSRLKRAQHKIDSLLSRRTSGQTALVVYAGDAHVVAPLTDDVNTLRSQLSALSPAIMPRYGSRPEAAITRALAMIAEAGHPPARLLLVTDGFGDDERQAVERTLQGSPVRLSILGVATEQGAPIPRGDGSFLEDARGNIVTPRLQRDTLQQLARAAGGRYSDARLDDSDVDFLLADTRALPHPALRALERDVDVWLDRGAWLVPLVALLALPAFRRGWLPLALLAITLPMPPPAQALEWRDLWQTPDQQGQQAYQQGDYNTAAERFQDPRWQAAARFQAGDYQKAAEGFARDDSAEGHYNRGIAQARAGDIPSALNSLEQALSQDPSLEDARKARDLLKQALRQPPPPQQQPPDPSAAQDPQAGQDGQQAPTASQPGDTQEQSPGQPSGNSEQPPSDTGGQPQSSESDNTAQNNAEGQPTPQQGQDGDQEETASAHAEATEGSGDQPTSANSAADGDAKGDEYTERWLKQIPDDPGGLLRRKFEYQQQQRERQLAPEDMRTPW